MKSIYDWLRARFDAATTRFDELGRRDPWHDADLQPRTGYGPQMGKPVYVKDYWRAHARLLSETWALAMFWLNFKLGESCAKTLLSHSDRQLARIAYLHRERLKMAAVFADCDPKS